MHYWVRGLGRLGWNAVSAGGRSISAQCDKLSPDRGEHNAGSLKVSTRTGTDACTSVQRLPELPLEGTGTPWLRDGLDRIGRQLARHVKSFRVLQWSLEPWEDR